MRRLLPLALLVGLCAPASASSLGKVLGAPVKALFKHFAAEKNDRVFHAAGAAYWATIATKDGGTQRGIVRVSRGGAGKPGNPDILGLAVKILGGDGARDQDFLLVTARSSAGLGARVPSFRGSFAGQQMSSLTSFRAEGMKGPITTELPAGFTTALDVSGPGATRHRQSFQLAIQSGGILRPEQSRAVAGRVTVHFDQPLTAQESAPLKFTPWHDGAGVRPAGLVNLLRKPAYEGSEAGRGVAP